MYVSPTPVIMSATPSLHKLWLLMLCAVTSSCRGARAHNVTCRLPSPAPGEPRRPVLADSYSVLVEATYLEVNVTLQVLVDFDYTHNRGRLRQTENGSITDFYYDYGTNEILIVQPDLYTCEVQQLNTSRYVGLMGDKNGHILSPAGALHFATQGGGQVYVGSSTVRGISVHQWSSCQHFGNTSMTLTWSFMDNTHWVASAAASSVPVECHVTGQVTSDDGSVRAFDHVMHFMHYSEAAFPPGTFEVPRGVVCPGRKSTKALPPMPSAMQFTGQTVQEERKTFTYTQEKYDAQSRMVIFEYLGSSPFTRRFGADFLTVVHDFSTGTEYVLDLRRGNCSMSALNTDPDLARFADPVTLRLRTASDMLQLTGASYVYQGQRTVRGVPCDVWLAEKRGTDQLGLTINVTFEWAFSQAGWRQVGQGGSGDAVPMQLIHTLEDFGSRQQTVTNVFRFTGNVPDVLQGVDVDSCFIGLPRNRVAFSISAEYRTLVQYFSQDLVHAVRYSLASSVGVSPLRVTNVQFYIQQFTVDVWFDLLSVPPVHSQAMDPTSEVTLDAATHKLMTVVQNNLLVIQLFRNSLRPAYVMADPRSLRVQRFNQVLRPPSVKPAMPSTLRPPIPTSTPTPGSGSGSHVSSASHPPHSEPPSAGLCRQHAADQDQKGYTAGVVAGTAVGMGSLGAVLGFLTYRLIPTRES